MASSSECEVVPAGPRFSAGIKNSDLHPHDQIKQLLKQARNLPSCICAVDPWLQTAGNRPGLPEAVTCLYSCSLQSICQTPEQLSPPWLLTR